METIETVVEEPGTDVRYSFLTDEDQSAMVKSAIASLEKMHFECQLNIVANSPDHVQNFEDGSSCTLAERLDFLAQKINTLKTEFRDMI